MSTALDGLHLQGRMITKSTLHDAIDHILTAEGTITAQLVPGIRHLVTKDEPLSERYYLRHEIESVRRIWAVARPDAEALRMMLDEDYEAARTWAEHVAAETSHDRLLLADLERQGISADDVRATPPLPSTVGMVETLGRDVRVVGSLPAVAHAVFVAWISARVGAPALERVREALGPARVEGAAAYVAYHARADHGDRMLDVAHRLVSRSPSGPQALFGFLRLTAAFFRACFTELHAHATAPALPGQGQQGGLVQLHARAGELGSSEPVAPTLRAAAMPTAAQR